MVTEPVLAELADIVTRQLRVLPNGGSMIISMIEEDGLHTYRITKDEVDNALAYDHLEGGCIH
jgi:hypothetical protein